MAVARASGQVDPSPSPDPYCPEASGLNGDPSWSVGLGVVFGLVLGLGLGVAAVALSFPRLVQKRGDRLVNKVGDGAVPPEAVVHNASSAMVVLKEPDSSSL